jgi:Fic family protein
LSIYGFPLIDDMSFSRNGNGRHARLMTDLVLASYGQPKCTWGITLDDNPLVTEGPVRDRYIHALQSADKGDIEPLMSFATSGGI